MSAIVHYSLILLVLFLPCITAFSQTGTGDIEEEISLDLDEAVGYALRNSFDLKKIQSQRKINDLAVWEKFRNFFPTFSMSYVETAERVKRDTDSRQHKISFDSGITVYDGGKTRLEYEVSKLQAELGKNDYGIAYRQIVSQVHYQYFKTIQLKKAISIYEKTLEQGSLQLKFITQEKELGEATALDTMEIEAQVKEIELNLKKAQDDYQNAMNALKLMLKIEWRQKMELRGDIEQSFTFKPIPPDISSDSLVSMALKNRKEIMSGDIECWINEKKYKMNRDYYIPNVILGLNYSLTDEKFIPHEKEWGISLTLSSAFLGNTGEAKMAYEESANGQSRAIANSTTAQVLNNMEYRRNIYESKMNMNSSYDARIMTTQKIALEVVQSVESLRNAWDMITLSKKRVELYDASLKIERLKAEMGEIRRYDLLEKEIERGQAAISYNDSLFKYLIAVSSLETSIGADVDFLEVTQSRN